MTWLAVAVGGALGSIGRHAINVLVTRALGNPSPYATALVNILGSAAIGLLAGLAAAGSLRLSPELRALLFVGILGGFTTFSSLSLDTLMLVQSGHRSAAALNVALQLVLGLGAAFAAFAVVAPGDLR